MSGFAAAETLPLHIIQNIAQYFSHVGSFFSESEADKPALKRPSLLPLMGVCTTWNQAVSSIFYNSALLLYDKGKSLFHNEQRAIRLDDILRFDKLDYLKKLYIYIAPLDFVNLQETFGFIEMILSEYGTLHNVTEVTLILVQNRGMFDAWALLGSGRNKETFDMEAFSDAIVKFSIYLEHLIPHKSMVNVHEFFDSKMPALGESATLEMLDFLQLLVGEKLSRFSSRGLNLEPSLAGYLQNSTLTRIAVTFHADSEHLAELIGHNRLSLQYLFLKRVYFGTGANFIVADNSSGEAQLVYPCLKELYVDSCRVEDEEGSHLCSINPFPSLRVLSCKGYFPSSLLICLKHLRPTLRALKLDMGRKALDPIFSHTLLCGNSFHNLDYGSFVWAAPQSEIDGKMAFEFFLNLLNISPVSQSIHINNLPTLLAVIPGFPDTMNSAYLKVLNLEGTYLTAIQAMQLVSRFKQLKKAVLALKDETGIEPLDVASASDIERIQESYGIRSTNLYMLCIEGLVIVDHRRAAGFIVLISATLQGVSKIVIGQRHIQQYRSILKKINCVLQEPVYRDNKRVQEITYSSE